MREIAVNRYVHSKRLRQRFPSAGQKGTTELHRRTGTDRVVILQAQRHLEHHLIDVALGEMCATLPRFRRLLTVVANPLIKYV